MQVVDVLGDDVTSAWSCQAATARWPSLGSTRLTRWWRHRYHAQTRSGWSCPALGTRQSRRGRTSPTGRLVIAERRHAALGGNARAAEHRYSHITKIAALWRYWARGELGEWVRIDPQAAKPLFDQFRTQIIDGIRDGKLPPGTRLPTVRELAGQLGLAVNTVARAYRELEAAGILETRGRFGTFVARVDPADAAMADGGAYLRVGGTRVGGRQGRRVAIRGGGVRLS